MYKGTCRIGYDKVNMPEYQIFYVCNDVLIHFYVDSFEDKEYCILDIPHNRIVVSERFPSF